ncbi:MAG: metallophosphoesterase [Mycoplasmataceae bacterium]|nr:metallophosphoesterase [Mycoplasmataceae bacterium]
MTKRILVIADSHGENAIMQDIITKQKADLIIHAGDYCTDIQWMKKHFHYFVDGNNDNEWVPIQIFTVGEFKFLLTHGHPEWSFDSIKWHQRLRKLGGQHHADVVIYGHSHTEVVDQSSKPFIVNPGSITLPRNNKNCKSYMIIEVNNRDINFFIKYIDEKESW